MPMPAGVLRVYQQDSKGGVQFVGEDRIMHTPKDETLNVKIGNAFDVICERNQIDFQKIATNVYEIEYEITLRNHKATRDRGRGQRTGRRHVADDHLIAPVDEDVGVGGAVQGAGRRRRHGGAEVSRARDLLTRITLAVHSHHSSKKAKRPGRSWLRAFHCALSASRMNPGQFSFLATS